MADETTLPSFWVGKSNDIRMSAPTATGTDGPLPSKSNQRARWLVRLALAGVAVLGAYLVIAYAVVPAIWIGYERRHPAIDETPGVTTTSDKHPGDPINVALIGSETDLKRIMHDAGWVAADPLGLRSDLKIAADTVLQRPYNAAPVSNLFLWGRREDLAFEQPVGNDPRQRHHVRFWKSTQLDAEGRPAWVGSATYDKHVGLSHTTGQITHHIAANVDAERDHLIAGLTATGQLTDLKTVADFHRIREGKNGGGDPWYTDGQLRMGTVTTRKMRNGIDEFVNVPDRFERL